MKSSDSRSYFLTQLIFIILLIYFSIVWCWYKFSFTHVPHYLDFYYLVSMLVFTGISVYAGHRYFKANRESFCILDRKLLVVTLLSFLFFIISRHYEYQYSFVWLDEYTQFIMGKYRETYSIVERSAFEQQPALDYVLSAFSYAFLGANQFAVKSHVLLSAACFFLVLPVIIYERARSLKITTLITSLALMASPIVLYSLEARPTFLALLFSLFYLKFAIDYCERGEMTDLLFAFSAQGVLVTTTGLQPEVFILVLTMSLWPYFGNNHNRGFFKSLFASNVVTAIFFLPLFHHIYETSKELHQFKSSIVDGAFSLLKIETWLFLERLFISSKAVFYPVIILTALSIVFLIIKNKKEVIKDKLLMTAISFLILFPIVFFLIYFTFINWNFHERYLLVYYSGFFVFSAVIISKALQLIKLRKSLKWALVLLLISSSSYLNFYVVKKWEFGESSRPNWKNLYSFLSAVTTNKDRVIRANFTEIGNWRTNIYVSKELYRLKHNQERLVSYRYYRNKNQDVIDNVLIPWKKDFGKEVSGSIYILLEKLRNTDEFNRIGLPILERYLVEEFNNTLVFKIPSLGTVEETMVSILKDLIKAAPRSEFNAISYETIVVYYVAINDLDNASKFLELYKKINRSNKINTDGMNLNKEKMFNRRVQALEDLIKG